MSLTMKNLISFLLLSTLNTFGAPTVDTIRINKEENEFIGISKIPTIHFFCKISSKQKESVYLEKFNLLFNKKEIQTIKNLHINLIFFEDINDKTEAIGLNAFFSNKENKYIINDFEVFFQNFENQKLINHHRRSDINKYYILEQLRLTDLVKIRIADVFCADLLADNIPQYKSYISQLYNPVFSEKEEIEFLKDSIKLYKTQLDSLQKKIEIQNFRIQKIESYFSLKISNSSPIEKEEKKSKEKEKKSKEKNNVIIKENE